MKKVLNILLYAFVIWFLMISNSQELAVITKSMILFTLVVFARINHKAITKFFHEKEEV